MPIIKCKMCGGDIQLAEDKTFGTCEYCGSTMTLPKVSDEQRAAAFNRGNHFRRAGEFDKALGVYEHIVADDDTDAEAHWCCALCRFGIEYVEDPATYEWLPTCHRASFDSFLEDVDYLAALEHSDGITRRQYQKDAAKIAEVQRGILAASQNTEPYDVFISYKELDEKGERTRDSILAQEIYYRLTEKGWRVFFSRISLEDVPGTQYEPYIFAALNSAKVMVVVGTSAENLNAVWVKNEWSRFLAMMRKDRSKLLIPCYRDMDPYDLPEQLSVLMSYDMGKIGFIQDLIRGVDKVLGAEKKEEVVKETVVVQQSGGPNVTALLKRGQQALEDGDWDKAKDFFDQVLSMDAENAEAFFGIFLAEAKCSNGEKYIEFACSQEATVETLSIAPDTERIEAAVRQYMIKDYLSENQIHSLFQCDLSYPSTLKAWQAIADKEEKRFKTNHNLVRAVRYAKDDVASRPIRFKAALSAVLEKAVREAQEQEQTAEENKRREYGAFLADAEEKVRAAFRDAQARQEAAYQDAMQRFEQAKNLTDFQSVRERFLSLAPYKDSAEMIMRCEEKIAQIKQVEAEETARKRLLQERAEKTRVARKKRILFAAVFAVMLVIAAYFTYIKFIAPAINYKAAEVLYSAEEYEEAIQAFTALEGYKDSAARIEEAHEAIHARDYAAAEALLNAGQYEEATVAFKALRNYKDSAARIEEAQEAISAQKYAAAEALYSAEQYEEAIAAFKALGNYKDSTARLIEARYAAAEAMLSTGNSAHAAMAFYALGDYRDARARSLTLWNEIAQRDTVAARESHTVGLKANGSVVAAGENDDGQCNVSDWKDIVAVTAGGWHTVGLKADGTVVAVGDKDDGQCNVSGWTDIVAIAAGEKHTVGLKADGTVVAVGDKDDGQCDVFFWKDIVAVAAGYAHTVGLRADGSVVAVGSNNFGQCGVSGWTDIVAVAAGDQHTVGLKADGSVVAVGNTYYGQCDVSDWTDIIAIAAGGEHTVGLKAEGSVVAVGYNGTSQCDVSGWHKIVGIAAGLFHTAGQKADGSVLAVGENHEGQCDVSGWKNIKLPNK